MRHATGVAIGRIARVVAAASASMIVGAAIAAPFAYVPNEGSGTVSIIDTANDTLVGEIKAGGKPRGIAALPDG